MEHFLSSHSFFAICEKGEKRKKMICKMTDCFSLLLVFPLLDSYDESFDSFMLCFNSVG